MNRELKRTAVLGTEVAAPHPMERHDKAPGPQPRSADGAYGVGVSSETAADTVKGITGWPVSFVGQATAGALLAGAAWIDQNNSHALPRGLAADQRTQLGKAPVCDSRPLLPRSRDFEGDETPAARRAGRRRDGQNTGFPTRLPSDDRQPCRCTVRPERTTRLCRAYHGRQACAGQTGGACASHWPGVGSLARQRAQAEPYMIQRVALRATRYPTAR